MTQRVTQKTIAKACNVSVATVSYALRQSSHISKETRELVHETAQRLGYRPDPILSSLAARKKRSGQTPFYASVAVMHPNPENSRATRLFKIHSRHFEEQMEKLGCSVTHFYIDSDRYTPERLAQILQARSIRGILLGWGQWPDTIRSFPWNEFAVISTERTDLTVGIDKVSMNHFHALDSIFDRLDAYPETRYGLILHDDCPASTESQILGAYYVNQLQRPELDKGITPFRYHLGEGPERIKKWYAQHQPDVIICHRIIDPTLFEKANIHYPKPIRVVIMEIDEESEIDYSGIYTRSELGRTTATLLARKMRSDEVKNSSRSAKLTLVNGIWHDGQTLHT